MKTSQTTTSTDLWPAPTTTRPITATVAVPGSKSASNRALILAALADGPSSIKGLLDARDTRLMIDALRLLGNEIRITKRHRIGNVDVRVTPRFMRGPAAVDVGLAGTVMRFLPPVATLAHGQVSFDGDVHARTRPMATIIESLKELGAKVYDRGTGRLPFAIDGTGELRGGEVTVDASKSSQFISGLLLSAARFHAGVTIHHVGEPIPSLPHIEMTIAMLAEHGVVVRRSGDWVWHVDPHGIAAIDRTIEPDLSNAAPFLAAAMVTQGTVVVPGWPRHTTQAGDALRGLLLQMGADVTLTDDGLTVAGGAKIRGVDVDLSAVGELAPTITALASLAESPTRLRGIAHLRGHESDRLAALTAEINRLGGDVTETHDGLVIQPREMHGGEFGSYGDHRMATAGAIIGLRIRNVLVQDIGTTSKTLPDFPGTWSAMLAEGAS